jgi:class 3 adenylate cyclase/CHASE2 domain-containing sensor protein
MNHMMSLRLSDLRARHRRLLLGLVLGFLASIGTGIAASRGYFFDYQGKILDAFFWLQGRVRGPEIVLVAIDDPAFQRLKERQPLPRDYLATLIQGLRKSGVRLIVMDIDLRQSTSADEDQALVAAVQDRTGSAAPVVVARTLRVARKAGQDPQYEPRPLYNPALETVSGFSEVPKDDDGLFRRIPLVVADAQGNVTGSLALVALAQLGGMEGAALANALKAPEPIELILPEWDAAGKPRRVAPLRFDRDEDWKINFIGPSGSFLTISSDIVYAVGAASQPTADDNPFRDRIAVIGAMFAESRDAFPTPKGLMYGMEIHANILHSLLARTYIQPIAWGKSLLLQLLLCVVVSALFAAIASTPAFYISMGIGLLTFFALNLLGSAHGGYWFDFLTPILVIRVSSQWDDILERRRVRRSFRAYLGSEVADRIYRDDRSLLGERKDVSILFTNIRGFTHCAEGLGPNAIAEYLNAYYSLVVQSVEEHSGIVADLTGDVALAIFDGMSASLQARNAVAAGIQIQAEVQKLNDAWRGERRPAPALGIGVHSGPVFAGTIGSSTRKKFMVVGEAVNIAFRVEKQNKELQTQFLISGETLRELNENVQVRECGELKLGPERVVHVYEVLGPVKPDA